MCLRRRRKPLTTDQLLGIANYLTYGRIAMVPVVVLLKETAVYASERMGWFGQAEMVGAPEPMSVTGEGTAGFTPPPRREPPPPAGDTSAPPPPPPDGGSFTPPPTGGTF